MRSIAIDGPAGAGKSTLAKTAARKLGFLYVDTGAIYRCVGLYVLRREIDPKNMKRVAEVLPEIRVELRYNDEGSQEMFLNGENVTGMIRTPEVSMYASVCSAIPAVRAFLLDMQREMARRYDVIMDGRDIGTVVLPNADVKIFLTASPEERARRRYAELAEKGDMSTYEEVLRDMRRRDKNDTERATSPLVPAEDAILLDTTGLTLEESGEKLCRVIAERLS